MGFAIEITEAGEAEYPLLEVLRETVFGEFGHVSRAPIAESLKDHADLLVLIAHLEGNPVGFSAGYRRKPRVFYINFMAIQRDYRGQGIGREFMRRQEMFARSRGYTQIEFNTFNHFPAMLRLGLAMGYLPVGVEQHEGTDEDLAIRFGKSLEHQLDETQEVARLREGLDAGKQIVGMVRDESDRLRAVMK
jgi:GNAT superfamily N-acetyltransferase